VRTAGEWCVEPRHQGWLGAVHPMEGGAAAAREAEGKWLRARDLLPPVLPFVHSESPKPDCQAGGTQQMRDSVPALMGLLILTFQGTKEMNNVQLVRCWSHGRHLGSSCRRKVQHVQRA
jgi:hypothetical protein